MINYSFNINEEIARWVTEVYVRNHQKGWWIAFTNPIAGPWKKITALNGEGIPVEIYRFEREGERPDLILVNDDLQTILIVEAKDFYTKIIASDQMKKSVRVIEEITSILRNCPNEHWLKRKDYTILPSFLWYTDSEEDIKNEDKSVRDSFTTISGSDASKLINIVVTKDQDGDLKNNFVTTNKISDTLDLK
jgi:hypothetical protein